MNKERCHNNRAEPMAWSRRGVQGAGTYTSRKIYFHKPLDSGVAAGTIGCVVQAIQLSEEFKMFNRKLTFVVGLTTRDGQALPRESAIAHINYTFSRLGLDGFSIVEQVGYWKGVPEVSLAASCYLDASARVSPYDIKPVAKELAKLCGQECVLWAVEPVSDGGLSFAQGF